MKNKKQHIAVILSAVMVLTAIPGAFAADRVSAAAELGRPKLMNHAAGRTSIKNTWTKVKGAKGYEVYRSSKKRGKYKLVKTIKKGKTVSWTNKKLKRNTNYFYKVRAYKTERGKKKYGKFSTVQWAVPTNQPNWQYSLSKKSKKTRTVKLTITNKSRYRMTFYKTGAYLKNASAVKRWNSMAVSDWDHAEKEQLRKNGIVTGAMKKKITVRPGKKAVLSYKIDSVIKYTKNGSVGSKFRYNKKNYGTLHGYKQGSTIWLY